MGEPQAEKKPATASIIGHIYSQTGAMLGGAKVTCNGRETPTLFNGTYKFEKLTPGTYTITASLKGYQTQSQTVTVKENETATLDFHLAEAVGTAKICGYVYDAETKKPIPNATVILILPISNRYTATDNNGYYEFTRLTADSYDIIASPLGYIDKKETVIVKEGETKTRDFHCLTQPAEASWG